jgi:hypothetical protein
MATSVPFHAQKLLRLLDWQRPEHNGIEKTKYCSVGADAKRKE